MKKRTKLRRFLFGMVAGMTAFSSVLSSGLGYAAEAEVSPGYRVVAESETETAQRPGLVPESGTEPGTGHEPGQVSESGTEPVAEHEPGQAPESGTESETEHEPEQVPGNGTESETEHEPEQVPGNGGKPETEQVPGSGTEPGTEHEPGHEPESGAEPETQREPEQVPESGTEPETEQVPGSETEPGTERDTEQVPETGEEDVPATEDVPERESETEMEPETESETETETETETEKQGDYQVTVTKGQEFDVKLNHEDGSYDAGETVQFSAAMPEGSLTAAAALKVKANRVTATADLLYSEVSYQADTGTFSFVMPPDDIELEVRTDYAEGGIMLLADENENPWDEATEIEANTYYYYSDGKLHPFNSVMGSGGNDSYKYVRYKVNGITYTVNAYCMQHSKAAPPSGTTYKNMIELDEGGDDKFLRKALFYGYGGPGWGNTFNGYSIQQIMTAAGCSSETRAMQHYLVDYLYDGESGFGGALSGTAKNMLREIKAALSNMPDPTAMELLPSLSVTADGTETETFTWKANEAFVITIHLEDGVKLVNETTGKTTAGNATVRGGEKFHLEAVTEDLGSLKGTYEITSNYPLNFHAMLLKLTNSQDIGFGYYTDSTDLALTVDWPEESRVSIIKTDAESGVKLAGAVYGVYRDEACEDLIVRMPATDENGAAEAVLDGTYDTVYLKELKAPKGYLLSGKVIRVPVSAGKTAKKNLTDKKDLGSLKIYKNGNVLTGVKTNGDKITFIYEPKKLAGAVYRVTAAADIVAADGTTVLKKGGIAADQVKTGADGSAVVSELHPGSYTVAEISAPANYVNQGNAQTVTVTAGSSAAEAEMKEVTFTNDRQKASVAAVKKDGTTLSPLSGAVFGLYADADIKCADGSLVVKKDTLIEKAVTGADGSGSFSADLPIGCSYYVKELQAPAQYLLNTADIYRFRFQYTDEAQAVQTFSHTFLDEEPRGRITIYKEGEALVGAAVTEKGVSFRYERRKYRGAVYEVYAGADIRNAEGRLIYQKGAMVAGNLTTGADGSATLSDLYLGTYTVKEKNAPQNLICRGESQNITLTYRDQSVDVIMDSVIFVNERQKASVSVRKADAATQNPLAGGVYGLYAAEDIKNADGKVVVQKGTFIEQVTTGTDGTAVYQSDLPVGSSYQIRELRAPEHYVRNTGDVYTFAFRYTNDAEAVVRFAHTFKNERISAKISLVKVDKETGKPRGDAALENAVYGLYAREDIVHPDQKTGVIYKAGTRIAVLKTDQGGKASVQNLYLGKYYVKELTPSKGYVIDAREHDLTCSSEGDLVAVVERTVTSEEQIMKQPFQLIKAANNGQTDAELLSGAGFTAYLISALKVKEDGSYDFESSAPAVIGKNGATELFTDSRGYAVSIAIPFGTYIVRETTTPHNFKPVKDFVVRISEHKPAEPQVWRVLLDDEFSAKLKIIKQDDETKRPVLAANTEFKVYDRNSKSYVEQVTTYPTVVVHSSYFTDAEGYLILPQSLKSGSYRIEEVTAPEGYTVNDDPVAIEVDADAMYRIDPVSGDVIIEAVYENHPAKGELVIVKKGEKPAGYGDDFTYELEELAGAVFEVYAAEDIYTADFQKDAEGGRMLEYAAGSLVAELTTDENGRAVLKDLPLGTYRVSEKTAPGGFVRAEEERKVQFVYADQDTPVILQSLEWINERQRVQISVVKQDAENENRLAGAEFGLYAKDPIEAAGQKIAEADTLLARAVTGEDGTAVFAQDLPFDTYYIRELAAPAGFVSSEEKIEITAAYQGQDQPVAALKAVFEDQPTVTEFTKSDITTGAELPGAVLTVLDQDGQVIQSWTSVKGEPHVIRRLHAGETYTLREEFAPYGYLRAEEVTFTVSDTAEIQKVEMKDEVPVGRILISKKGEFLKEVTWNDMVAGTMEAAWGYVSSSLQAVTFEVYASEDIRSADGESEDYYKKDDLVTTITTDALGYARADDLPPGRYYVLEKETADGFVLDGERREIDLTYRDQDTPIITYDEEWQNSRQKAKVTVLKKEGSSERTLEGGVFALCAGEDIRNRDGAVILRADTIIEQRATDRDGRLAFSADLPVGGRYYVKEVQAPAGFVTTDERKEFTFDYAGADTAEVVFDFVFENEPTVFELTKSDLATGAEVPGAKLKVTDAEGSLVEEWISGKEPHRIQELEVGKEYTLTEVIPADGYVTAESITFTAENTADIQKIEMKDDVTKVRISKTDMTDGGAEVVGAKLVILDKEKKVVEHWISGEEPHYVERLPIGTYTLVEEAAPKGYLITNETSFEIKDTGEVQAVQMKDDEAKGRVIVEKTDYDTGEPMKGAEFVLRGKNGEVLETLITDQRGRAESDVYPIAVFRAGKYEKAIAYTLEETKTQEGYRLDKTKHEVVFQYEDDKTPVVECRLRLTNKKIPKRDTPEEPKTGDTAPLYLLFLALLASGSVLGAGVLRFCRRKR